VLLWRHVKSLNGGLFQKSNHLSFFKNSYKCIMFVKFLVANPCGFSSPLFKNKLKNNTVLCPYFICCDFLFSRCSLNVKNCLCLHIIRSRSTSTSTLYCQSQYWLHKAGASPEHNSIKTLIKKHKTCSVHLQMQVQLGHP